MNFSFSEAQEEDLTALVQLLADDELGQQREDLSKPLNSAYILAFQKINSDPNNELIVVKENNKIAGMLQLTFIPYLTHTGSRRCLIEGVRIHRTYRGKGLGKLLINWAIERASSKNCHVIQLTSDKKRPDAISFYNKLGFDATHEGFKLKLNATATATANMEH